MTAFLSKAAIRTLNDAIDRARTSMLRTEQAAKHCIGGPDQKARLQVTADDAAQRYRDIDDLFDSCMRFATTLDRSYDEMGKAAQFLNAIGRADLAAPLRAAMGEIKSPIEAAEGTAT